MDWFAVHRVVLAEVAVLHTGCCSAGVGYHWQVLVMLVVSHINIYILVSNQLTHDMR